MTDVLDVAVIGGGASGLCNAVALKSLDKGLSVAIFEQLPRVGKKLITTGNGRCNITNKCISISRFHSENPDFIDYALTYFDNMFIESFFADLGVVFTYEGDKVYPYSLQASSVVDALRFAADKNGVITFLDSKVTDIKKEKDLYAIFVSGKKFLARAVVIAAGLFSGGEKLGSNGSIFKLLKDKGYKTVKTSPAIVQIKTDNKITKSLKGIKVNADVKLLKNGKEINADSGEVLFCDYGLSGPPVMQISREISRQNADFKIVLDLMPEYSFQNVEDIITFRLSVLRGRSLENFFTGMLNTRVGQQIIKMSGKKLSDNVDSISKSDVKTLCKIIKGMEFSVTGTLGYDNSQVTAGGLDTTQFDDTTMMSKKDKGLFCIGEILDVDGDCGGFNLNWAWASAICAAYGAIAFLGDER
ncbi:MAG: aminoacetone oxidase family FAD-binding enzyme [Clostridia bacterium]|nr:aminoacetone oxidase family FAD-binding enzyme [Clostridia bacterium]